MPEITIAMPAHNAARHIQQSLDSVLRQDGVDLEVIVVDDGSTDDTAAIVAACRDPRVRLVRTPQSMGAGYCYNVALRDSRSAFIAHVDAGALLLPGALRAMVDLLGANAGVGQAHCYYFDVDERGRTTRQAVVERWKRFHNERPPNIDYRTALAYEPDAINHLRTYRRTVLEALGGFDESLGVGAEYDMALRLLDRATIALVPEFLYVRRAPHPNVSRVASWWLHYRIRQRLMRRGQAGYLTRPGLNLSPLVRPPMNTLAGAVQRIRARLRRTAAVVTWRTVAPLRAGLYRQAVQRLSWWPLRWSRTPAPSHLPAEPRIAYYIHGFPQLSETFIQREVAALRRAGLDVRVIAHHAPDQQYLDPDAQALMRQTHYLDPIDPQRLAAYARRFLRRRPLTLINLFLHVVFHRNVERKSWRSDREICERALYLAGTLQDAGITQVHCPWASHHAFVAVLAAQLLRIRYSVQARAFDIYRDTSRFGQRERLAAADFIVTNARYNEANLKPLVSPSAENKITVIYEGIEVQQFVPQRRPRDGGGVVRLLSIGRLVEQKGFAHLLRACRILKDRGDRFTCEIIGGRSANEVNYYIAIQKLRRALDLQDEVTFLGAQSFDRVLQKYTQVDIFVLPAVVAGDGRRDVTPNVLIEAMAMQLPVISTRSGGIPEIVEDGVSGLLVLPEDPSALAAALVRLIEDPSLCEQLGRQARTRVEERFDISKNIAQYVALFRRV